jgi:putative ABC transport system substrate-binding protein
MPRDVGAEAVTDLFRRRALAALAMLPLAARVLAQGSMKRVGVFGTGDSLELHWKEVFPKEFEALGFVDGRNFQLLWFDVASRIKERSLSSMAEAATATVADVARADLDCVVTYGPVGTRRLHQALGKTPIVTLVDDPVGLGVAKTLARPGLNVTGMFTGDAEAELKTLEMLRKLLPRMTGVGWIGSEAMSEFDRATEARARAVGLRLQRVFVDRADAGTLERVRKEFAAMRRDGCLAAFIAVPKAQIAGPIRRIGIEQRIALLRGPIETEGFLIENNSQRGPEFRTAKRLPLMVTRILRGEKPGDIPFEGPDRYELRINMKTAESLGIAIPSDVQLMAAELVR